MVSVSDCPFCGQAATIPEDLEPAATVQCPHCQYEFLGDRALMYAVEAPPEHVAELPPALIPVLASEAGASAQAAPSDDGPAAAGQHGEAAPTPTQADQPPPAAGPSEPALEAPSVAAAVGGSDAESAKELARESAEESAEEPPGELASRLDASQPEGVETASQEALGAPSATVESVAASGREDAGTSSIEMAAPPSPPASDASETQVAAVPPTEASAAAIVPTSTWSSPIQRERRKPNPVRTAIGVVISGLLGLAVAYGALLGLSKLGLMGRGRTPAATRNHVPSKSNGKHAEATMVPPPQPTEDDEWPGLDENRFDVDPKEKNNAKPSGRAKKGP